MARVLVIGGAGRIGLSLATKFAENNNVDILDTDTKRIFFLIKGKVPFYEKKLQEKFEKVKNKIAIVTNLNNVFLYDYVFVTIGTPIDEYLNPKFDLIYDLFESINSFKKDHKNSSTIFCLCSTVYPGTTKNIENKFDLNLVYCPERMATGNMVDEISSIEQIISGNKKENVFAVEKFFISNDIKTKTLNNSKEGELVKLFTNAYRYINFSISNQFYMMCDDFEVDFDNIYNAMKSNYPRMKNFAMAGFTGGYCLRKDTLQLASYNNNFQIGYDACVINEKMPLHIFRKVKKFFNGDLSGKTVGILGMAFKKETDDSRDSLSFRLKKIFKNEAKEVFCSDEYIIDESFVSCDKLIDVSDIIIVGAFHNKYKKIIKELEKDNNKLIIKF